MLNLRKYWTEIALYGVSLGLLLTALSVFQYKWILLQHSGHWHITLLALLFTILGVWAGLQWKNNPRQPEKPVIPEPPDAEAFITKMGITTREMDVLRLMATGLSNQQIADELFVSLNTVKTHISSILSKLGAERRTQAVAVAKSAGLIE